MFFKRKTDTNTNSNTDVAGSESKKVIGNDLAAITNQILEANAVDLEKEPHITVPLSELSLLGATAASMLPAFSQITSTVSVHNEGLFRIVNITDLDTLKAAKDGTFWGAFKNPDGTSKMAKLAQAGPQEVTSNITVPLNPYMMVMAAMLVSIEKDISEMKVMEEKILSFLEDNKEAEIEADVKTLMNILEEYKYNWEGEQYRLNHHKLVLDIKRTAEKNIIFYKKQISEALKNNQLLITNKNVNVAADELFKKNKYYRMSLYVYSLSSLLEVMLNGNFNEDYLNSVKHKLEIYSEQYSKDYLVCEQYLENISSKELETNVLKMTGFAAKKVGKLINNIPVLKEGNVDEWLIKNGDQLTKSTKSKEQKNYSRLEELGNPDTEIFMEKLDHINNICNKTKALYFDNDNIYLVTE